MALSRTVSAGIRDLMVKNRLFSLPLPFNASDRGDFARVFGKASRIEKIVFHETDSEGFVILACIVLIGSMGVDHRVDRGTCPPYWGDVMCFPPTFRGFTKY